MYGFSKLTVREFQRNQMNYKLKLSELVGHYKIRILKCLRLIARGISMELQGKCSFETDCSRMYIEK